MDAGHFDSDVIVIGGGPGGSAAAITCASLGLRVRLLESDPRPSCRPGETLHPGVATVLAQLGVADRLASAVGSRHTGIRIKWGSETRFDPYGQDNSGVWLGYQVRRSEFDALLLNRARELGVDIHRPCSARKVAVSDGVVSGVMTTEGTMTAPMVVDASGRSHWLGTELAIERHTYSMPLVARYGYAEGLLPFHDEAPQLIGDASGWLWTAMIHPGLYQWTRVALDGTKIPAGWYPDEFQLLTPVGPPRGTDVTWRLSKSVAGPGWFSVGDAAALLDPTAAKGILKALLSGITAGKLIAGVLNGHSSATEAASVYNSWLSDWFLNDAKKLIHFYSELDVAGFSDAATHRLAATKLT
ncbi:MAG: tryptophan 7-halogenase [Planctomycetota bacterium]